MKMMNELLIPERVLTESEVEQIRNVKHNIKGNTSNPFIRLLIIILWLSISSGVNILVNEVLHLPINKSLYFIFNLTLLSILYKYYVPKVEKREAFELHLGHSVSELIKGIFTGFVLISIPLIILLILGFYSLSGINGLRIELLAGAIKDFHFAFLEELFFRVILFRLIEETFSTKVSLITTSILFGASHFTNPNADLFNSIAIAIEAGLLLGAAYITTRRIWYPLGIHFAWNYFQGYIFGINVSGKEREFSLLNIESMGHKLFSGGEFGIEASIVSIIICILFSYYLLRKYITTFSLQD